MLSQATVWETEIDRSCNQQQIKRWIEKSKWSRRCEALWWTPNINMDCRGDQLRLTCGERRRSRPRCRIRNLRCTAQSSPVTSRTSLETYSGLDGIRMDAQRLSAVHDSVGETSVVVDLKGWVTIYSHPHYIEGILENAVLQRARSHFQRGHWIPSWKSAVALHQGSRKKSFALNFSCSTHMTPHSVVSENVFNGHIWQSIDEEKNHFDSKEKPSPFLLTLRTVHRMGFAGLS